MVEYSEQSRWLNLSKSDVLDIQNNLSSLVLPDKDDDELARRFDVLILNFQLAILSGSTATTQYMNKISSVSNALTKKTTIPAVAQQLSLLNELQTEIFWKEVNINRLENVRVSLRDLMKYLDKESQINVVTTFEDELDEGGITNHDVMPTYGKLQSYKDRVESYVREHKDHIVIQKLKTNKPITEKEIQSLEDILFDEETIGTKDDYVKTYGDKPLGVFIRQIVGLDITVAKEAFADFIQAGTLSADQMTFIDTIITYLTKNGVIDKKMLFEPPFTNLHDQGLFGIFDDAEVTNVLKLIDRVNDNASVVQVA